MPSWSWLGNQIRSVGMLVNGGGFCTGALINNNCDDGTGYFLTADHCGTASGSWNIRWNWKSPAEQSLVRQQQIVLIQDLLTIKLQTDVHLLFKTEDLILT